MPHRVEGGPGPGNSSEQASSYRISPEMESQSHGLGPEEDSERLLPIVDIAKEVPLSVVRIQALLKEGKIEGEMRREGRGRGKWYTSVDGVLEYKANLPTPSEFGKRGAEFGKRGGRPRKLDKPS